MPNEYALLAWQARVLERAHGKIEAGEVGIFELDDRWLPELVRLTNRKDGPKRARDLLAEKGILLERARQFLPPATRKSNIWNCERRRIFSRCTTSTGRHVCSWRRGSVGRG